MKIFGIEIGGKKGDDIVDVSKKPAEQLKVLKKVLKRELTRSSQDVGKWRSATTVAESEINPQRVELYRIYKDVTLDAHLSSLMNTIKLQVTSGEFMLCGSDGVVNDEQTEKLKHPWFRQYLEYYVDSLFYGHSLIQINEIKDDAFDLELVPREHVVPEHGIVKRNAWSHATDGVEYRMEPWSKWLIEIGDNDDFGLLHKATPLVLWKKGVFGAWSHYAELFGMPIRVGKTDILNPANRANMESMLENMGSASYAVLNTDDMVEFIATSSTDAFKVYNELIDRVNSELSKLILGQTGTTDEKSFVGSANVHADILSVYITSIKNEIRDHINHHVLKLMEFHGMVPSGLYGKWDNSEKQSMDEKFKMTMDLLKHYNIAPEWINDEFNIPVEKAEPQQFQGDAETVIPDVENLYKGTIK